MNAEKIDVTSYSGSKGDERPVKFNLRGRSIDVVDILDQWVEEELGGRKRKRYFTVKGNDGGTHRIYCDEDVLNWYYVS